MPLPILPSTTDLRTVTERVNPLIKYYNREDLRIPLQAADTGSSTAYVVAPVPGIEQYIVGQIFNFIAANANTTRAPTLAVNGLAAGTIKRVNGSGLSPGDIPAGPASVIVTATTPVFALISPYAAETVQTFLGGNVALNNTGTFFAGPNTGSIGAASERWNVSACAVLWDTAGAADFVWRIHDGTNALVAQDTIADTGTSAITVYVEIDVTLSAATTFTAQAKDISSTSGSLRTTAVGTPGISNKSTWIRAQRLA